VIHSIEVEGLSEFNTALKEISVTLRRTLREDLRLAAEPVARSAQELAMEHISGMKRQKTVDWSQMKIGASAGAATLVYIVPKRRRRKGSRRGRPNLVNLMLKKAMEPALIKQYETVEHAIERAVNNAVRKAGF
jgi:hypothetical protein